MGKSDRRELATNNEIKRHRKKLHNNKFSMRGQTQNNFEMQMTLLRSEDWVCNLGIE
jgi:hypothetical protein